MLRKKVGLALGSGGAKGLAHIGVLKAFRDAHVPVDMIAGSSIGAVVGALYAKEGDIDFVEHIALTTNWTELLPFLDVRFGKGLLKGEKLRAFIEAHVGDIDFSELRIPFSAVATNMHTGQPHVFQTGKVAEAVRASASIPLIFRPAHIGAHEYSDAGLSMPLPVRAVRAMGAEVVVAVDLDAHAGSSERSIRNVVDVAQRTIELLSMHLAHECVGEADTHLVPPVSHIGWEAFFTTRRSAEVIALGEQVAREWIPLLRTQYTYPVLRWFGIGSR